MTVGDTEPSGRGPRFYTLAAHLDACGSVTRS